MYQDNETVGLWQKSGNAAFDRVWEIVIMGTRITNQRKG